MGAAATRRNNRSRWLLLVVLCFTWWPCFVVGAWSAFVPGVQTTTTTTPPHQSPRHFQTWRSIRHCPASHHSVDRCIRTPRSSSPLVLRLGSVGLENRKKEEEEEKQQRGATVRLPLESAAAWPTWSSLRMGTALATTLAVSFLVGGGKMMAQAAPPPTASTMVVAAATVEDPLEAFGQALTESKKQSRSLSGWPDSPSPLPTLSRSAADLTSQNTPNSEDEEEAEEPKKEREGPPATSLAGAIEQAKKRRVLEPLTHG